MRRFWHWLLLFWVAQKAFAQLVSPVLLQAPISPPVTSSVSAGTPILFQHVSTSTNQDNGGEDGKNFVMSTESLPANSVMVLTVSAPHGSPLSVSDTLVGSWGNPACTADSGSGNMITGVFVQPLGSTGGTDTITVNIGSTETLPVQFSFSVWENINTSNPVNSSLCVADITPGSGGVISPGSFIPQGNNAYGGVVVINDTPLGGTVAMGTVTGWTAASSYTLMHGLGVLSTGWPDADQYYKQSTAAALTPSITATGESSSTGDFFNSVTVALNVKNNSQTAPSSIHVLNIIHDTVSQTAPLTTTSPAPMEGNLRVLALTWPGGCPGASSQCVTSVTWSDGCTATEEGNAGAGDAVQYYAQNCSACPACTISMTYDGTGTFQGSLRIYDVENAAASSFQNQASGNGSCTSPTTDDAPSITPTGASSGLVIADNGIGTGPGTGVSAPAGAVWDLWNFTGQTDSDQADNADSQGHYYFSSTTAQNWTWDTPVSSCYWVAAVYN